MTYAGFWKRFVAGLIDLFIMFILMTIVGGIIIYIYTGEAVTFYGLAEKAVLEKRALEEFYFLQILNNVIGTLVSWIYHATFESSSKQATPGKMVLGIKVTDLEGRPVGFGKATGRYFGKIISMIILGIGLIMIAFTRKKQGLHDMMAGCLVVNK